MKNYIERIKTVNFFCWCSELDFQFPWVLFEVYSYYLDFSNAEITVLQYAAAAQWLIQSSIDILKLDESSFGLIGNPTSPIRALK